MFFAKLIFVHLSYENKRPSSLHISPDSLMFRKNMVLLFRNVTNYFSNVNAVLLNMFALGHESLGLIELSPEPLLLDNAISPKLSCPNANILSKTALRYEKLFGTFVRIHTVWTWIKRRRRL